VNPIDKRIIWARRLGVICLCTAYVTITSGFLLPGVLINCTGQLLLLPYGIRHKAYDLAALSAFYLAINLRILLGA
jgi:hypothetical protein